jgi:hypothetical protein
MTAKEKRTFDITALAIEVMKIQPNTKLKEAIQQPQAGTV